MSAARLRIVVLGLSLSSSWGNGHATTYRALLKALARRGHDILFLERERPWYAANRDLVAPDYCELRFYESVDALDAWRARIVAADAVIVGSYVPEGIRVGAYVHAHAGGTTAFYDIDTPVTLAALETDSCPYLAAEQIPAYELYLSFTGGPTLDVLRSRYGAPAARALHCSVDPELYAPRGGTPRYDLGYLGTYSADRQPPLEKLLIEPARRMPQRRFVVAGPQYPDDLVFPPNVERIDHVPPHAHAAFYGACRFTLNVTRSDMIRMGHSPSVRLFEAAACGTPIVSDVWDGLDAFFEPGSEIVTARTSEAVMAALTAIEESRRTRIADAARRRVLAGHTADHRAAELESVLIAARAPERLASHG
jgi:spore maturation protein CgeB